MHQLLHGALQIGGIWEHIELCLVIDTIPNDHILTPSGHRTSNREQQTTIECDFEKTQHFATQRTVGQIANARKSNGKESASRMRMLSGLQARSNAKSEDETEEREREIVIAIIAGTVKPLTRRQSVWYSGPRGQANFCL